MTLPPTTRVWRYMSFAKLVWILQKKQLWLSRPEDLGDKWEVTIDGQQMNTLLAKRPSDLSADEAQHRIAKNIRTFRDRLYISCWNASEHESHALWRIYCPSSEGVAIQTTLGRLSESTGGQVVVVAYGPPEFDSGIGGLVGRKRPMFAYEQEVRVVLQHEFGDDSTGRQMMGVGIDWDPEQHVEAIWVHPNASPFFMECVTETVRRLAPGISDEGVPRVFWSAMSSPPPF